MVDETDTGGSTPVGIVLVCLLLGVYGLFWVLTWILAGAVGNGAVALLSMVVAAGVLLVAYFLYRGNWTAWWVTIVGIAASTVWRLSLVAEGESSDLSNAVVGVVLLLYILARHEFFRSTRS